jgi:hypothetical protein
MERALSYYLDAQVAKINAHIDRANNLPEKGSVLPNALLLGL